MNADDNQTAEAPTPQAAEIVYDAFRHGALWAMEIVLDCPDGTPPVEIYRAIQKALS